LREQLLHDYPHDADYQSDLADSCTKIGIVLAEQDKHAEALKSFETARDLRQDLLKGDPDNAGHHGDLGGALNNVGLCLEHLGRFADALAAYRQAVDHGRREFERAPTIQAHRSFLSSQYENLGRLLRRTGMPDEAIAIALERKKLWPDQAQELYNVACELALAAELVGSGKEPLSAAQQASREKYLREAVKILHDAAGKGFRDAKHYRKDSDLRVLQGRKDFQELLAELDSGR
jgi:tetratricopeptide (TPR) repeat protein